MSSVDKRKASQRPDPGADERDARKAVGAEKPNRQQRRKKPKPDKRPVIAKDAGSEQTGKFENDISWYNKFPNLLVAAGQFPFPNKPGMIVPMNYSGATVNPTAIPSVWAIEWQPSIGVSATNVDPASLVAKQLYKQVRSVYSSELDADGPDLLMYLVALDSIFSYIAWCKRVYRLTAADNPYNYDLPDAVLVAMGFAEEDIVMLRQQRVMLWQNVNELIAMTRQFKCPAVMDFFNRHYWMNDNLFTDADSASAQIYCFTQKFYYMWGVNASSGAGQCRPVRWVAKFGDPVGGMFEFGTDLISALSDAGSSYTISGYLTRAFPDSPSFVVDDLASDEKVALSYSTEVLTQIENARSIPFTYDFIDGTTPANSALTQWVECTTIRQDPTTNAVVCSQEIQLPAASGAFTGELAFQTTDPYLNLHVFEPTAADVAIASRLHNVCSYRSLPSSQIGVVVDSGSEIVLRMIVARRAPDGSVSTYRLLSNNTQKTALQPSSLATLLTQLSVSEQFDWHPLIIHMMVDTSASPQTGTAHIFGDILNFNTFTKQTLKNLNRICLYSEFNSFAGRSY